MKRSTWSKSTWLRQKVFMRGFKSRKRYSHNNSRIMLKLMSGRKQLRELHRITITIPVKPERIYKNIKKQYRISRKSSDRWRENWINKILSCKTLSNQNRLPLYYCLNTKLTLHWGSQLKLILLKRPSTRLLGLMIKQLSKASLNWKKILALIKNCLIIYLTKRR